MKKLALSLTLAALALTGLVVAAQPMDFGPPDGDDPSFRGHFHAQRLEGMLDYLGLDEDQAEEWQLVIEDHFSAVRAHRERMEVLKEEFRSLAEDADPDLQQLGQLALDMHREGQAARSIWDRLSLDLEALLTPEQTERFQALKAARDMAGPRFGHRGPRTRWQQPEID